MTEKIRVFVLILFPSEFSSWWLKEGRNIYPSSSSILNISVWTLQINIHEERDGILFMFCSFKTIYKYNSLNRQPEISVFTQINFYLSFSLFYQKEKSLFVSLLLSRFQHGTTVFLWKILFTRYHNLHRMFRSIALSIHQASIFFFLIFLLLLIFYFLLSLYHRFFVILFISSLQLDY